MHKRRLGLHRHELRRRQEPGTLVEEVACIVIAQHECVPHPQIEEHLRCLVSREALLEPERVQRYLRRIQKPLQVVAPVVGVRSDGVHLGQSSVIDDVLYERGITVEELLQDARRCATVAEPGEQLTRTYLLQDFGECFRE